MEHALERLSHRRLVALAVPNILANLTQPLLSAVDTGVAGHLPTASDLGGVALGGLFFAFVFWAFGFLRMGTTGLVAQAHGAGDARALVLAVARGTVLALVIGLVLLLTQGPLIAFSLTLFGAGADTTVAAQAYCHARIWSAPLALFNYVVLGTLLGTQRVRLALALQVFTNLVNILAVGVWVYVLHRGIAGIGAATACADVAGALAGWGALRWSSPRLQSRLTRAELLDTRALRRLALLNASLFIRTVCLLCAFGWFARSGARQGDVILAANALLLNFQTWMAYALDGFANAAEALVGAAVGAHDRAALTRALRLASFWSAVLALGFALAYAGAGGALIDGLTDLAPVRAAAARYLPWAAASPLISVWCFQLDGVFIGATRTRDLMSAMAVSLGIFLAAALPLQAAFGNDGLWAAFLVFMAARGVTLAVRLPGLAAAVSVRPAGATS